MNSAFNKNESELAILILSISLKMLPDVDSLLDKVVEILWNFGGETVFLQDSEDLASSDALNLGDSVVVS